MPLHEALRALKEELLRARQQEERDGIHVACMIAGPVGWRLVLTDHFTKSVRKVDKKLQGRVLEAITKISEAPMTVVGDTLKPLTADLKGLWRYRVGDFRLVYDPNEDEALVTLVAFEPRGDVY